jgi:multiple antibiotic resistance protein
VGESLKFAVLAFTTVFFVVDPLAAVPIFLSITARDTQAKRAGMARRAALAAFCTLALFSLAGGLIFRAFGISLGAFKAAGGLLLFLMSIDMMRAQPSRTRSTAEEEQEGLEKEDVAIVPLAIPLLSGPGAIATVMVLMSRAAWRPLAVASVIAAVGCTCAIAYLLLRWASSAQRYIKKTTLHVFERVMGLLLAAVAVEFIVGGLRELLSQRPIP